VSLRIYVADPSIRQEQIVAMRNQLPDGWLLARDAAGAAVILTQHVDVAGETLAAAGAGVRLIARLTPGRATIPTTSVAVIELTNRALIGVAEHAVTLILALSRHVLRVARETASQQWVPGVRQPALTDQHGYAYNWIGLDDFGTLYRKTVGIVGLGYVGRAVARRLQPFGVRLLHT